MDNWEVRGNDAVYDILGHERFQGAVNQIEWLTGILDIVFIQFISVIAFIIISAALLRNVLAGAYVSYPKFFDRIQQAKQQSFSEFKGHQAVGIVWKLLAFIIPDVKSLTDFNDNNVDPKHYFTKAIPQMFLLVMIGITIYNGYYRDVAAVTGKFGSEIFVRLITNVRPVEMVESVFNNVWKPEIAAELDNTDLGHAVKDLTMQSLNVVRSKHNDVKNKTVLTQIANDLENRIREQLNTDDGHGNRLASYYNKNIYKSTYSVRAVVTRPNIPKLEETNKPEGFSTFAFSIPLSELNTGTTSTEEWYLFIKTTHTRIPPKDVVKAPKDLTLVINRSKASGSSGIKVGSYLVTQGDVSIGSAGSQRETLTINDRIMKGTRQFNVGEYTLSNKNLYYRGTDGVQHFVRTIRIINDSSATYHAKLIDSKDATLFIEASGEGFPSEFPYYIKEKSTKVVE